MDKDQIRNVLTIAVFGTFIGIAIAVFREADVTIQASVLDFVKNITMVVIGYHFGSSKSSSDKSDTIDKLASQSVQPKEPK